MDDGFQVAAYFLGVGILWLVSIQFLVGIVEWLRKLVG
jgi:hypothetical protein